ncbi:ethanolamine ammonia-lyase [Salmonella enterica]|nr:ethanolamine ammonia-lyase [Salmonella enterica subsp. enterica serovar Eastbourne]EFR4407534.1 ethanolamine ammonia-lyase [Salmonella enterica]
MQQTASEALVPEPASVASKVPAVHDDELPPLDSIFVPAPKPEETYQIELLHQSFSFNGLKQLLGYADISKAGDRNSGLAAPDEVTREAARSALSSLTLQHLYDNPLTTTQGTVDNVMHVNYQIDLSVFRSIATMTVGELKNYILSLPGHEIRRVGTGLTGVMVAAVAKLCDVHELIYLGRKLKSGNATKGRTLLGLPGTLSSRLQPNHPTDNLNAVTMLVYTGLSIGAGDAVLGLNPAIDTVDNISALLRHLDQLRRETGVPTQICVLSHIKTQLQCLEAGAPVEIMFQSLAGTEATLTDEFDVTVDLLDEAYRIMKEKGPLKDIANNWMYFETGQGSEVSYNKHNGIDMTTTEALCYGLGRRYKPIMFNNVTGFIGPETHYDNFEVIYSGLQDHFMAKLMGLPMGCAPCFTLHSQVTTDGQQMAVELLTAAGANFYMDVYLGLDRMLAYFDVSGHDDQTMREIHGLTVAPEYLQWAIKRGIFLQDEFGKVIRGPYWGNPRQFCQTDGEFQRLVESLPAAYGFENAGPRPANKVTRLSRANQAVAREAIYAELQMSRIGGDGDFKVRVVPTSADTKLAHLNNAELGAHVDADVLKKLQPENNDVQIVISDGLSAEAIHHNMHDLLPALLDGLRAHKFSIGEPIVSPYGRVKLSESLGDALKPKMLIMLIGERPGGDAIASRSMSAYLVYRIDDSDPITREAAIKFSGNSDIRYENTVISNIYSGGLPPVEAASVIVERTAEILKHKAAGNRLERLRR